MHRIAAYRALAALTLAGFMFVAAGGDPQEVAQILEADHLVYLDREAMNAAARVGNKNIDRFCNACFNGEYPTGDITQEVLDVIGGERDSNRQKALPFKR